MLANESLLAGKMHEIEYRGPSAPEGDHAYGDEDKQLGKQITTPAGLLVAHMFSVYNLDLSGLDASSDEMQVYAQVAVGAVRKNSCRRPLTKAGWIRLADVKFLPVLVHPTPCEDMNRVSVSVLVCNTWDDSAKHRVVGKFEMNLHKLFKCATFSDSVNIVSKKGLIAGQMEIELGLTYGCFGYGNSFQLKNLYAPRHHVKMSLLPRVDPECEHVSFRGTSVYPRRCALPPYVPINGAPVEDLQTELYHDLGNPIRVAKDFPVLREQMTRIDHLKGMLSEQTNRAKRIAFLRKLLQQKPALVAEEKEDGSDSDPDENRSPQPTSLINFSKLKAASPGISPRRKEKRRSVPSSEAHEATSSFQHRSPSIASSPGDLRTESASIIPYPPSGKDRSKSEAQSD